MNSLAFRIQLLGLFLATVFLLLLPCGRAAETATVCKKKIPQITFKNLSPPYNDYEYFSHHERFPFQYQSSAFSRVNAWWLAEASTLVYADEAYVRQRFRSAGLETVRFFSKRSTQCFIASNRQFAIVAFRGSEIWKRGENFEPLRMLGDLLTDVDIRLSPWSGGGRVHRGFKDALEDVWNEIFPYMEKLADQGLKIWLTGHSLGAALATLAADRYTGVQGLYTFGSPRVGDAQFEENFALKAYRVVNGQDLVARVPPRISYRHVGELKFIDADGRLLDRPGAEKGSGTLNRGEPVEAGNLKDDPDTGTAGLIPDAVRDHVPLLYAVFLWNSLLESRHIDNREKCDFTGSTVPLASGLNAFLSSVLGAPSSGGK